MEKPWVRPVLGALEVFASLLVSSSTKSFSLDSRDFALFTSSYILWLLFGDKIDLKFCLLQNTKYVFLRIFSLPEVSYLFVSCKWSLCIFETRVYKLKIERFFLKFQKARHNRRCLHPDHPSQQNQHLLLVHPSHPMKWWKCSKY